MHGSLFRGASKHQTTTRYDTLIYIRRLETAEYACNTTKKQHIQFNPDVPLQQPIEWASASPAANSQQAYGKWWGKGFYMGYGIVMDGDRSLTITLALNKTNAEGTGSFRTSGRSDTIPYHTINWGIVQQQQ